MANRFGTKPGYMYVLVHPSDPDLYKIGVTTLHPEKRLAQHNSQHDKYAGRIVTETGQNWTLKTYIAVLDPYWAERAFWGATPFPDIPYRVGIEIERMEWQLVQKGREGTRVGSSLNTVRLDLNSSREALPPVKGWRAKHFRFAVHVEANARRAIVRGIRRVTPLDRAWGLLAQRACGA